MKRKRWFKVVICFFCVLIAIDVGTGIYFYNLAIKRNIKTFLTGNEDLQVSAAAMDVFLEGDWRKWVNEQNFEIWEIESFDGIKLRGYFLKAKEPTDKTVVFAHGYLGNAKDMGLYGKYYYEKMGYNLFTADLRGHGQSGGEYIGFGWHDRLDYIQWIQCLLEKQGEAITIVLHGLSMGAATVLMASGENLPDNVKAIIADSPYTSVYDLFEYQLNRMYHLPSFPVLPTTSLVTKWFAGYSFNEASALKQVKKTDIPILYFHGNNDTFVPTEMVFELYENTNSEAEIMTFDGASHGEAFAIYRDQYVDKLKSFLSKHVND
mgnify:CR=1 FL=1